MAIMVRVDSQELRSGLAYQWDWYSSDTSHFGNDEFVVLKLYDHSLVARRNDVCACSKIIEKILATDSCKAYHFKRSLRRILTLCRVTIASPKEEQITIPKETAYRFFVGQLVKEKFKERFTKKSRYLKVVTS